MTIPLRATILWLLLAGTGALLGILAAAGGMLPGSPERTTEMLLPHLVPARPDGVAFRFAMADDVIHEQYLRHGKAYYEDRNRRMRELLAQPTLREAKRFDAMDDLGVGLDLVGKHDEAIALMRQKLQEQGTEMRERDRYTTYANLGTFLIHGNFRAALEGHPDAMQRVQEGLEFIHHAIEVNPGAHFGRERWQAIAVEFLLSAMKDPTLLLRYDMVGNRLSDSPEVTGPLSISPRAYAGKKAASVSKYLQMPKEGEGNAPALASAANRIRTSIARVGVEEKWNEDAYTSLNESPTFDEPALGIVGMWRLGGGANPHFALALAGIMERVNRPELAWNCYARAAELADRFCPDPAIQKGLREHCEKRMRHLAGRLGQSQELLQFVFTERLAAGKRRMTEYETLEAKRIPAGDFPSDLPYQLELDSRSGTETAHALRDSILIPLEELSPLNPARLVHLLPAALLGAGVFVFLASMVREWRPTRPAVSAESDHRRAGAADGREL